jgi:hypothetical protein
MDDPPRMYRLRVVRVSCARPYSSRIWSTESRLKLAIERSVTNCNAYYGTDYSATEVSIEEEQ